MASVLSEVHVVVELECSVRFHKFRFCNDAMSILCSSRTCSSSIFCLRMLFIMNCCIFYLFVLFVAVLPCVSCRFPLLVDMFGVSICGVGVCCALSGC